MLIIAAYFFIVGVVCLMVLKRPAAALILATNIFTLKQWSVASSPFLAQKPLLTNLIAGSVVLAGVILQFLRGKVAWPWYPKEALLIAALFAYAIVSVNWAPDPVESMTYWYGGMRYIIIIVFLAPLTIRDSKDLQTAFSGMVFFGAILAALLLFTVKWDGRLIVLGKTTYGEEVGGNPLTVGQLGGTLVLLAMLYRSGSRRALLTGLKCAAFILGFALMLRSGSRGQIAGALLISGVFWAFLNPSRSMLKPIFVIVFIVVFAFVAKIGSDLFWKGNRFEAKRFDARSMSDDYAGRIHGAMILLGHWVQSPFSMVLGLGSSSSYKILGNYPHIVPLEVLGEEGIVGFIILCSIILGTAAPAARRSFRAMGADLQTRSLFACITGLWVYSFLLINKQGSLLIAQDFFFYSILLAKFQQITGAKLQEAPSKVESTEKDLALEDAGHARTVAGHIG